MIDMDTFKESIDLICSSLGICFDDCHGSFEFSFYSEAGQDFRCYINSCSDKGVLCSRLRDYIGSFNCFDEARLWVGDDGHGKKGAPYYYRDIVKDMGYCKRKLRELLKLFREKL